MKKIILLCILLLCVMAPPARAVDVNATWEYPSWEETPICVFRMYWGEVQNGPYPNLLFEADLSAREHSVSLEETQEYFLVLRACTWSQESDDSNEIHWYRKDCIIAARGMFSGQSTICGGFIQ